MVLRKIPHYCKLIRGKKWYQIREDPRSTQRTLDWLKSQIAIVEEIAYYEFFLAHPTASDEFMTEYRKIDPRERDVRGKQREIFEAIKKKYANKKKAEVVAKPEEPKEEKPDRVVVSRGRR